MNATLSTEAPPQIRFPILFGEGVPALAKARLLLAFVNPNVAEIFGPKALRSLYIRPSRNDCPFSRAQRMFNTLSFFKMLNPAFGGTDPIYTVLNSNFMQR